MFKLINSILQYKLTNLPFNNAQKRFESVKKQIAKLLAKRKPVEILERDLQENFVKGSGPGGQAVNKRNNAVWLVHKPTGLQIKCHKTRSLELNRHEARKMLRRELDIQINGEASLESIEMLKMQERVRVKKKKSDKKYGEEGDGVGGGVEDDRKSQNKGDITRID